MVNSLSCDCHAKTEQIRQTLMPSCACRRGLALLYHDMNSVAKRTDYGQFMKKLPLHMQQADKHAMHRERT